MKEFPRGPSTQVEGIYLKRSLRVKGTVKQGSQGFHVRKCNSGFGRNLIVGYLDPVCFCWVSLGAFGFFLEAQIFTMQSYV